MCPPSPVSRRRNGFTLIELMIVVVIVGILAAIAVPRFGRSSDQAKEGEAPSMLRSIYTLQERYRVREDRYTDEFGDLELNTTELLQAKYYDFRLTSDGATFVACAQPKGGVSHLKTFAINERREISEVTGACSGNAP